MKKFFADRPIVTFLFFTFALSSIFYSQIIHTGKLGSGFGLYVTALMWCPGLAALLTSLITAKKISELGWQWGKSTYQLQSYYVPILYAAIAYIIIWTFGWGGFYDKDFVTKISEAFGWNDLPDLIVILLFFILTGVFGIIRSASSALGEELGWRGFLVPQLSKKFDYTQTSLITGAIWSVWHFPILLFADYNGGTPIIFELSCFVVMVISISFIATWYRLKSNSLWTGVILHASHNLFVQSIFTPLTKDTGNTKYFIDEFGIVLPVVSVCFAIYFWSKRTELNKDNGLQAVMN